MGWASFLENILQRLNSDLDLIKESRNADRRKPTKETERHLNALIRVCEKFMAEIRTHLDLATDPDVDVAHEIIELRKQNAALTTKVALLAETEIKLANTQSRCQQLQKDFDHANGRAAKNYAQLEELDRRYKHLEKEHTRLKRGRRLH